MKKYLIDAGYKFRKDHNDMTSKQFTLVGSAYADGENSTLGNRVVDLQETYQLFLKSFEPESFRDTLKEIINNALNDGVCVGLNNAVEVEKQENGYMVTMSFVISGTPPASEITSAEWVDEIEITWVDENGDSWTN